jgi:GT2 family glycosyltransferase
MRESQLVWEERTAAPTLSIVIVNWNTRDLLQQCLESIVASQPAFSYEVWVVDNASQDGSVAMVRTLFPWVRLIVNEKNVGFAQANNQAIRASRGAFVLLLNPDTQVMTLALDEMVRFLQENRHVGAVGSRILNPDGTLQPSCYPFPTLAREAWRLFHLDRLHPFGVYDMAAWDVTTPRPVEALMGAALMVRREALDQVGLLDEDYFMYTEEIDLCYRLHRGGWALYWLPQARIVHYGGQSTRQVRDAMFLRLYESKVLFFRKRRGWLAAQAYKGVLALAALPRILLAPLTPASDPAQRQEQRAVARHYRQLLAALPGM